VHGDTGSDRCSAIADAKRTCSGHRTRPRGGPRGARDRLRAGGEGRGTRRMTLLSTILAFIVVLGAVIVVHEFGHYLAARACNVKVLRFSVGFGRPLMAWRRGKDRTEWVIAAIPFGGYVK